MKRIRERASFLPRQGTRGARAAILSAAVAAALSAPLQPAQADTIPARTVLEQPGWNAGLMPPPSGSADPAEPSRRRVLAASARPANAPQKPSEAGEPFRLPLTLTVEPYLLQGFDQPMPRSTGLQERPLFTPTGGEPAIALQLFLPTAAAPLDTGASLSVVAAGEDMMRSSGGADGAGEETIVQIALGDAKRGYLAQLAPKGIDTLREARCAAAVPRPVGCEEVSETNAAGGGLLSGLSFATIPLPSAIVLLLAALVCLAAVAWRRKTRGL